MHESEPLDRRQALALAALAAASGKGCNPLGRAPRGGMPVHSKRWWVLEYPQPEGVQIWIGPPPDEAPLGGAGVWVQVGWTRGGQPVWQLRRR